MEQINAGRAGQEAGPVLVVEVAEIDAQHRALGVGVGAHPFGQVRQPLAAGDDAEPRLPGGG